MYKKMGDWLWVVGALSFGLFVLYALDFVNLTWSATVQSAPLLVLLVALMDTAVLSAVVRHSRWHGWRLATAVAVAFYALKTFLVGIEAVYLTDVLTPALTRTLFINGLVTALIFAPLLVWGNGRWSAPQSPYSAHYPRWTWRAWSWRLAVTAIGFVILFIAGGLLIFTPMARGLDAVAYESYTSGFAPPDWLLLFILVRGLLWAMLCLPLIRSLNGRLSRVGLLTGLLFATLMGSNLLWPTTLPATIQMAHFMELFVENFLFGWWVVWWLGRQAIARPQAVPLPFALPKA